MALQLVSSSGYNVYLTNFSLYLIPISKNISEDNINVEVIAKDRIYDLINKLKRNSKT